MVMIFVGLRYGGAEQRDRNNNHPNPSDKNGAMEISFGYTSDGYRNRTNECATKRYLVPPREQATAIGTNEWATKPSPSYDLSQNAARTIPIPIPIPITTSLKRTTKLSKNK